MPSRRGSVGKMLVAAAVLAPALLVVGLFLVMQSRMYGFRVHGPLWPWIAADAVVLGTGLLMLRGEDL